ncbi:alpha/beta-hydrolase, partial [Coemansia reversa NRRL 1564]
CTNCQVEDIAETELNNTWSTLIPAFSRGYVGIHHKRKQVVVAFRGTTHIMDALSDAQIIQVPWPPSDGDKGAMGDTSRVHWGFLLAYHAAQTQIRSTLEAIAKDTHLKDYSLHFVGHSLGAAQATLAFVDYSLGYPGHSKRDTSAYHHVFPQSCNLITFGSPRVGNLQFVHLLNSLPTRENVLRVVHESDIVPHFPRSMLLLGKYSHVGREIWVRDTAGEAASEIIICSQQVDNGDEDPQCSTGTNPLKWNIFDHLVYPGI